MKQIILSILFLCSFSATALMAQGQISGKIIDKSNGETLVGAAVQVENTTNGAVTDIEGNFSISVVPGKYTLVVSYISYQTSKVEVEAKANEVTYVNCVLEPTGGLELKEVVIVATQERSSATTMLIERKKAAQVSDGISADMIRKTPDRTTSDVLKRVTGASIQEGKFAIIRGMNDRYNAGYLDGALLPSTESDRKAFAFDVVPANLIDNLLIIKAGSPDLAGDFGGGVIKINTKSVPDKFTQSFTIGAQMHSLTTFNDFLQFKRYGGEQLNIFGNQRDIPNFTEGALKSGSTFPSAAEKAKFADISKNFNNDWSNSIVSASPNSRFAYSIGLPIRISETQKIGIIAALTYSNTRKITDGNINTYDGSGPVANFADRNSAQNVSTGGIFNINYVASKTQINFRNLVNINTDNNTVARTGMGNIVDGIEVQNKANLINYNRLYNGIVSAKHIIGDNFMTLNASVSYSNVNRKVPDYRIVNYTRSSGEPTYRLSLGDFFNTSTGRFASKLNESLIGGSLDLSKRFDTEKLKTEIKAGYFYQTRDRAFSSRSFVYNGTAPTDPTYNPATDLGEKNISASNLYIKVNPT
jgi:CarboxypepD_reg-like domain/TonB-dependent Receptor Plug Domain